MYTVIEISEHTNKTVKQVYSAVSSLKIEPDKMVKGRNYYSETNLYRINEYLDRFNSRNFIKYYPLKTTETFYIYGSKLNYIEL